MVLENFTYGFRKFKKLTFFYYKLYSNCCKQIYFKFCKEKKFYNRQEVKILFRNQAIQLIKNKFHFIKLFMQQIVYKIHNLWQIVIIRNLKIL